jgi:hypothetical protein
LKQNIQLIFGRNQDWVSRAGLVHSNQRGLFKTSVKACYAATICWVSAYGSITFNPCGKEFSDKKIMQQVFHLAVTKSSSRVTISKKEEEELLDFEKGVSCKW